MEKIIIENVTDSQKFLEQLQSIFQKDFNYFSNGKAVRIEYKITEIEIKDAENKQH
jgi:hypothetical protein